jgi:hypothetical protein
VAVEPRHRAGLEQGRIVQPAPIDAATRSRPRLQHELRCAAVAAEPRRRWAVEPLEPSLGGLELRGLRGRRGGELLPHRAQEYVDLGVRWGGQPEHQRPQPGAVRLHDREAQQPLAAVAGQHHRQRGAEQGQRQLELELGQRDRHRQGLERAHARRRGRRIQRQLQLWFGLGHAAPTGPA